MIHLLLRKKRALKLKLEKVENEKTNKFYRPNLLKDLMSQLKASIGI